MPRLILIPGLAGDATMWQAQLAALPAALSPVVTDVHTRAETVEAMARALLEEHGGELILCGASMGGMVAMETARQAPQRVRGLALLGTSARPETDDMRALRESAIELFRQGRAEEVIRPNVGFAFAPQQANDPALVQAYLDFVLGAGAEQLIRQNRAVIARPDARAHLPQLRCPTLVMCGEADQLTPPECAREIAALVPGAELVLLPQCGHMLTMEKPDEVNATLLAWLARVNPSRP
ncbi:alpha/beta fold hydrolase [Variovorax terrae]|uniref:Alpha/beta hydrolase n=1 Tax=Variovorax terrae TaxID=2923278 RepID=A0A9X1VRT3_9BURK|nr:alpha/beta hydrolase [Variovorax terrae]MCJ0762147.1 alpha/beta hydrolase [Variovorax terrae]